MLRLPRSSLAAGVPASRPQLTAGLCTADQTLQQGAPSQPAPSPTRLWDSSISRSPSAEFSQPGRPLVASTHQAISDSGLQPRGQGLHPCCLKQSTQLVPQTAEGVAALTLRPHPKSQHRGPLRFCLTHEGHLVGSWAPPATLRPQYTRSSQMGTG